MYRTKSISDTERVSSRNGRSLIRERTSVIPNTPGTGRRTRNERDTFGSTNSVGRSAGNVSQASLVQRTRTSIVAEQRSVVVTATQTLLEIRNFR